MSAEYASPRGLEGKAVARGVVSGAIYLLVVAALGVLYAAGATHVAMLGAVVLILLWAGAYGQQAQAAYQGLRATPSPSPPPSPAAFPRPRMTAS